MKEFDIYMDLINEEGYENYESVSNVYVYDFGKNYPVSVFGEWDLEGEPSEVSNCCYAVIHVHHLPLYPLTPDEVKSRILRSVWRSLVKLGLATVTLSYGDKIYYPSH